MSLRTLTVLVSAVGAAVPLAIAARVGNGWGTSARVDELKVRGRALTAILGAEQLSFLAGGEARAADIADRLIRTEDLAYVVFFRADETAMVAKRDPRWAEPKIVSRTAGADLEPRAIQLADGDELWDFAAAVRAPDGSPLGRIQFGLSPRTQGARAMGRIPVVVLALAPLAGMMILVWLALRRLLAPVKRVIDAIHDLEGGDLSKNAVVDSPVRELGELARAVNTLINNLRSVAQRSRAAAEEILRATNEVTGAVHKQGQSAAEVAQAISETGATVRELAQASSQAAERAQAVIEMTGRSEQFSQSGLQSVEESVQEMRAVRERVEAIAGNITDLSDRMQQIGDIIATVTELAERSNLLALNAAIEAAKAGPQGRGFAVVAVEMRNLAEGSKAAAGQVRGIIADIQKAVRAVVEVTEEGSARAAAGGAVAERTGHDIRRLVEAIRESSLAAKQIAAMAKQQNLGIESVAGAVTGIHDAIAAMLSGISALESTSQRMRELNLAVSAIVEQYQSFATEAPPAEPAERQAA